MSVRLLLFIIIHIYSEEFFKEAGQVVDIKFDTSKKFGEGRYLGFGIVEFATAREAQMVIAFFFCLYE